MNVQKLHRPEDYEYESSGIGAAERQQLQTRNDFWGHLGDAADIVGRGVTGATEVARRGAGHGMNIAGNLAGIGSTIAGGTMRLLEKTRRGYKKGRGRSTASSDLAA